MRRLAPALLIAVLAVLVACTDAATATVAPHSRAVSVPLGDDPSNEGTAVSGL
ncbi:hypothetical protein [Kitasatospora mediocidica]|uniref:hypothetical protein n=1 Tax=Kitasatospora mediocidica TaxID=58352 RepID=UPI0012FC1161|nr:hypothetical protein [Kitasatospora mediocidica]